MTGRSVLITKPWDVNDKLRLLGLEQSTLLRAVETGFSAWADTTPNDPVTFPGYAMWAQASRALRDLLAPLGWRKLNECNQSLVIDPKGNRVLLVATGDENTCNADGIPKTRSKKGPKTIEAVERNNSPYLFSEMEEDDAEEAIVAAADRETWILLMYRDMRAQCVKSELSRPILMDVERRIGGWSERIALTSLPFGDISSGTKPNADGGTPKTPEIKILINKRA